MAEEPEHWRQFQGSELGGLLAGIYGGKNSRPKINYPKPKQRKSAPQGRWRPVNNELTATDPRNSTFRRDKKVNVPKVARRQYGEMSLIDCAPRRKQESVISAEMDDLRLQNSHYRPAHFHTLGDAEKERLSQVNTYHGGKGLPEDLTVIPRMAPFEIEAKLKRQQAMAAKRANFPQFRSANDGQAGGRMAAVPRVMTHNENMANQISDEINERVEHMEALQEAGTLSKTDKARLQSEITTRITELKSLEGNLTAGH